jgi:membrane-bound ClpP family serine protease
MNKEKQNEFLFGKENYYLLVAGIATILLGYILLSGGGSDDPNVFTREIFSFRRITLAPIVCLIGFGIVMYAIMKKPKA